MVSATASGLSEGQAATRLAGRATAIALRIAGAWALVQARLNAAGGPRRLGALNDHLLRTAPTLQARRRFD